MFHTYTTILTIVISVLKLLLVSGDIYLHNPRGSNNRLDGAGRNRANANRMFDSENNNRGGYNVGSLYYYSGSILPIEWTSQHSCAGENAHCDVVIQYMCSDLARDGITTKTIPEDRNQCLDSNCNKDTRYGMHEDYNYYNNCKYRQQNTGLFTVNKRKNQRAIITRQNPNGARYAYECPEERDYYPYWHPTPWIDIAVLTNNVSMCKHYRSESQNVKSKFSCVPPSGYVDDMRYGRIRTKLLPITKEKCEVMVYPENSNNTFKWVEAKSFNHPPPTCGLGPKIRDNHLGNTYGGFPNLFNWTIPAKPCNHVVLRVRYNVSTGDYPLIANVSSKIDIGALVGITDEEEAKSRGYLLKDNPTVQPLKRVKNGKNIGGKLQLGLAINTAQFGRTFEDRSHIFSIKERPKELEKAKIHNINVRGKRGNIVQVYPSVEYDFVPNRLMASAKDYIHFQWTGSNTNPRNNDGQGLAGTDRSNIVSLTQQIYPEGTPGKAVSAELKYGHWGNNCPNNLDNVTFLGFSRQDLEKLALLYPGQYGGELSELDDAGTYFDLGPKKITSAGTYHYMSTRNNNFSNRSQKGKIVVTTVKSAEEGIGWSGGKVVLDEGDQGVWINEGLILSQKLIRVEEWSEKDGNELVKSKGGYIKVGENFESNFLAVFPFDDLVDGADVTVKIKVSAEDVMIYHSLDYIHWKKINNVRVKRNVATFQSQMGGVYVARKSGGQPTTLIALVVVLMVAVILVVGTVLYCRKRPRFVNLRHHVANNI